MTTTQHTGVIVSVAEADAWHEEIRHIMAARKINFGDAVNVYIDERRRVLGAAALAVAIIDGGMFGS